MDHGLWIMEINCSIVISIFFFWTLDLVAKRKNSNLILLIGLI